VKHRRRILINQLPVILEANIRKKKSNYFLGTESKFFIMCLKEKILRSRFLPFLDDLRYAWATIVALYSQGLKEFVLTIFKKNNVSTKWRPFFISFCLKTEKLLINKTAEQKYKKQTYCLPIIPPFERWQLSFYRIVWIGDQIKQAKVSFWFI
jgi:hypothetical protein